MASKKREIPYAAMLGIYREMLGRWRSEHGEYALVLALNIVLGAPPDSSRRWRAAQIEVLVDAFGHSAVRKAMFMRSNTFTDPGLLLEVDRLLDRNLKGTIPSRQRTRTHERKCGRQSLRRRPGRKVI